MAKEWYELGEAPPLGEVPPKMYAWLVRPERFGEPKDAMKLEVIDVPELADDEVLVYVMAAGVNYNNVWAGLGVPIDVIGARNKAGEPERFHIGGSDASGIVYKVGKGVTNVKVGDEVVMHCGMYSRDCPSVQAGNDQMYSPTYRIWAYESNWGSFAQFCKVQDHQCLPKPKHLTWEGAAAYMLVGATAYRMLCGWKEHPINQDDMVLIWGGAGGLGSMAIQIVKAFGGIPIAIISSEDKRAYCESLGAKGCINRNEFDHWGMLPHWKDNAGYAQWLKGVRQFGKAMWDVLGDKRAPKIVFEHPGETTIPTSIYVCDTGGMVVICAGTSGYNATVDLRYLWMRQKRLQGSHFANDEQAIGINNLVLKGLVDPCLSRTFKFAETADAHQLMYHNKHPHGNMGILVGATETGLGITGSVQSQVTPATLAADDTHSQPVTVLNSPREPATAFLAQQLQDLEPVVADDGTLVQDLMHRGVISCAPNETLEAAAQVMVDSKIHSLIVIDGGQPVGVISQTDMALARQGRTADEARQLTVRSVMTLGYATCDAGDTLTKAISQMAGRHIHRLVVMENGQPIGVLSMTDVVRKMFFKSQ